MSEAWEWKRLGDVTIPTSTWNPRLDPRPLIRYVDVSAVSREDLSVVSDSKYSAENAPSRARKKVETGDTIFATVRPALRRIAQISASLHGEIVSTAFCVLRPNSTQIHPDYLYFAMQIEAVTDGIAAIQTGASYPAVRDADVFNQAIPVPPLQDQIKIAHALNQLRASMLQQSKYERVALELKRSTTHTLFTRGLRGETRKETEIGPMPESWEVVSLGSVCEDTDLVDLRSESERVIEYVDVSSISRDYLHIESTARFVLKEAPGRARKRIFPGDVIFATVRPTLLRVAVVPNELGNQVCSTAFCILRRDGNKCARNFIYYLMQRDEFVGQLADIQTGASYPAVTDRMVKQQLVPVPSIDEQREIVAIFEAVDRKIDLHRRKRAVLDELFKALLHKLMTGEIGVRELNHSVTMYT